jgi:GAF domain-containing protein
MASTPQNSVQPSSAHRIGEHLYRKWRKPNGDFWYEVYFIVRKTKAFVDVKGFMDDHLPVSFASLAPGRSHVRRSNQAAILPAAAAPVAFPADVDLEPAISLIAERAKSLTGASGAAIALRKGDEMVCRARAGRTAPDLGVRLQSDSGISADCVRTGQVVLCHDAQDDPHVDVAVCQRLGVRSILAAPLRHFRRTLGVFEVFSGAPHAFAERDVATMQLLSSVMVAALSRLSPLRQSA